MKILATSDLHGYLPVVPPCDVFLIGGDVCPIWEHGLSYQGEWLDKIFRSWLAKIPASAVVGVAGNHDFIFEDQEVIDDLQLPWTYLKDTSVITHGLHIYGLPWVPNLPAWAFYLSKEGLKAKYDAIPKGVDIVISHGPPYRYGDKVWYMKPNKISPHVGCKSATDMLARVKPKAVVTGHIHEAFGHYRVRHSGTQVYNVSYVDEMYVPGRPIVEIELTDDVMVDALENENQADIERQIRSSDSDARPSSEPAERPDSRQLAMATE